MAGGGEPGLQMRLPEEKSPRINLPRRNLAPRDRSLENYRSIPVLGFGVSIATLFCLTHTRQGKHLTGWNSSHFYTAPPLLPHAHSLVRLRIYKAPCWRQGIDKSFKEYNTSSVINGLDRTASALSILILNPNFALTCGGTPAPVATPSPIPNLIPSPEPSPTPSPKPSPKASLSPKPSPLQSLPPVTAKKPPSNYVPPVAAKKPPSKSVPPVVAKKPPSKSVPPVVAKKPPPKWAPPS